MIYLDNSATTFPKPECVYSAVDFAQRNLAVNTGRGNYKIASEASALIEETRMLLARLLRLNNPNNIVFSPSATFAANQVIFGLEWDEYKVVYVSPFEHNAVARPLEKIRQLYGIEIVQLPFNKDTQTLDIDKMEKLFSINPPDYVFVNHISNVTGTVLPINIITESAKKYDAVVAIDGSQSVGLIDYRLSDAAYDYLIFAGHKNLYASFGVGGFIQNTDTSLSSFFSGGNGSDSLNLEIGNSLPTSFEIGSPNIIAIASLNASLKWINEVGMDVISAKKKELTEYLVSRIKTTNARLYLPAENAGHTSIVSFNIEGYEASEIGVILSEDFDIAVRTGYHCAPFVHQLLDTADYLGTVRVSLGYFNTKEEIDQLIDAIVNI